MITPALHFRILAALSLGLIALCSVMAVFLFRQQATIAAVMGENIKSRRAAADLEESLVDLAALVASKVEDTAALHDRIAKHLERIGKFANHNEERPLAIRVAHSFEEYLRLWRRIPARQHPEHDKAVRVALDHLEGDTIRYCQELHAYNDHRIEAGAEDHRLVLRELAWGMVGVGVTGGVAGLLLGYLVTRGLIHSIRRLQVQIRDAAGMLAGQLPEVVLHGEDLDSLPGQMQGVIQQIEDVVARLQQREREVRRADQLAAVGQLASGVAHEIRNPLTAIKMLVQAGSEEAETLNPDDLQVIEREIRRMEKLLDTFLNFARPSLPDRRPQDLVEIIRRTVALIRGRAEQQRVALELAVASSHHAPVDGEQIIQVLVNLCLNALDAMPTGGQLSFDLRSVENAWAEIQVLDSGPGISAQAMTRLFEPFYSTKETGLGLGLLISRRIVEDHGGSLTARNRVEGGACMTIRLPLQSGQ